jgi:hypothetical protein
MCLHLIKCFSLLNLRDKFLTRPKGEKIARAKNNGSEAAAGGRLCPSEAERRRRAFPPPNFVFCFAKSAADKKGVALDPPNPYAGNNKELPKIFL